MATATIDSARAERRVAGAVPNPVLAGTPNSPYQYSIAIPLDVTPQRRYRTRVAELGISAAAADRRETTRQVTVAVARAFYDALLAAERRAIVGQRRDAMIQILLADSARYHAGDAPLRTLTRTEVEVARADADLARADVDVHASRLALQGLMGVAHADTSQAASGSMAFRRLDAFDDSLIAIALRERPDRQASDWRVAQSRSAEASARALLVPTPQLAIVRQFSAPFENGRYYSLGLAFELPSFNRYGGQREKSQAALSASVIAAGRSTAQVERDVVSALATFRTERDLAERYQTEIMDKMSRSVEAVRYAYAKGAASLLEVLDAVRSEQDVRIEYASALHDYWTSAFVLNAAVGRDVLGLGP